MLTLPVSSEAWSLPQRTFGAVIALDLNSDPGESGRAHGSHHILQLKTLRPGESWVLSKATVQSGNKNKGPSPPNAVPVHYTRLLPVTLQIKTIMSLLKYLLA